jgi:hypothetical protein
MRCIKRKAMQCKAMLPKECTAKTGNNLLSYGSIKWCDAEMGF